MIIGHQKQWNFLKKVAETKRFSHAYLFSGQEKLGKKTLALKWISFLFGFEEDKSSSLPSAFAREQNAPLRNHPDLIFIEPQSKEIQILQIRDLTRRLSLKPSISPIKAAIIDNAHLMNEAAQTSLLKTLEEPKGDTLLILISDKAQVLFPTILSRVQTIKFNSVKKEEIKNYLLTELPKEARGKKRFISSTGQGISEKETEKIVEIASGRPGVALTFCSDKEKLESFNKKIAELNKISNSPLYFRFQYVKNLAENIENIKDALDIWLYYYRNILLKQPTMKLKNIINHIQTTKFLLSNTNLNPRLALERLMLEL